MRNELISVINSPQSIVEIMAPSITFCISKMHGFRRNKCFITSSLCDIVVTKICYAFPPIFPQTGIFGDHSQENYSNLQRLLFRKSWNSLEYGYCVAISSVGS